LPIGTDGEVDLAIAVDIVGRTTPGDRPVIVENQLANRPYLAGNAFTMADIPMGVALHRWFLLPIERPAYPRLAAYYDRLKQRPAFQAHCGAPLT